MPKTRAAKDLQAAAHEVTAEWGSLVTSVSLALDPATSSPANRALKDGILNRDRSVIPSPVVERVGAAMTVTSNLLISWDATGITRMTRWIAARRWTSSPTTPGDSPGDHHQTSPSTLPKRLGPPIVSPRQGPPGYWSGPSAPRCPESTVCDHRRPAVPLLQTVMTATPAPASRRRTVAPRSPSTRRRAVDSGA